MTNFEIRPIEPTECKRLIQEFWRRYLPDTPMARLEWLEENPAGAAIWLFAIEKETQAIAGMISVTKKKVYADGRLLTVGIMGDLMTGDKYRVFGPAMQLIRAALEAAQQSAMSWVYTIPNPDSEKIIQRAGLQRVATLMYLVKPVRSAHYLKKYLPRVVAQSVGVVLDFVLGVISRETYHKSKFVIDSRDGPDDSLAELCRDIRQGGVDISSQCNDDYLVWRYIRNPEYPFRLLTARENESAKCAGFIPYSVSRDVLRIYELVARDNGAAYQLISAIRGIARHQRCKSISIGLVATNRWRPLLRRCGFLATKEAAPIYGTNCDAEIFRKWSFFSGDRNL